VVQEFYINQEQKRFYSMKQKKKEKELITAFDPHNNQLFGKCFQFHPARKVEHAELQSALSECRATLD